MQSIDKKNLKKLDCPKCGKPKLRFQHAADGIGPDGGSGADREVRCDVCRTEFKESNEALQAQYKQLQAERTPPPATARHQ